MASSRADKQEVCSIAIGQLLQRLATFPTPPRYWVGFSGGADSTALLVALSELAPDLAAEFHAIHFNHGLQTAADDWQAHCLSFCAERSIPLFIQQLELNVTPGQSPEEQARHQRYAAVEKLLGDGEIYLTAHHADDNAETFFLHLMRGSGMDGLAAIPPLRKIGKGWVARPLLEFRRQDLEFFLRQRNISWLQDPSNLNPAYDRNYVRNSLFPDLDKRWPGVVKRLNQTASHARDFTTVLAGLLASRHGNIILDNHTLALEPFIGLDPELQAMLLRQWLRDQEIISPPKQRLREFLNQLNTSEQAGKQPELRWARQLIKRHGKALWLHELPCPDQCPTRFWASGMNLDLGTDFGQIHLSGNPADIPDGWEIGPRRKGARMTQHTGGPRRKLKELMRECGLPPWLRSAVPVLYWQGEVAALGDWLLSARLQHWLSDSGLVYTWQPNHPLLCKLQSVSVHSLDQAESLDES